MAPAPLQKALKGNLGVGSQVIVKRTGLPAIIQESEGTKQWKIQLVDPENGTPTSTFLQGMKSQMIRRPKANEFPSGENHNNVTRPADDEQQEEQNMAYV